LDKLPDGRVALNAARPAVVSQFEIYGR